MNSQADFLTASLFCLFVSPWVSFILSSGAGKMARELWTYSFTASPPKRKRLLAPKIHTQKRGKDSHWLSLHSVVGHNDWPGWTHCHPSVTQGEERSNTSEWQLLFQTKRGRVLSEFR